MSSQDPNSQQAVAGTSQFQTTSRQGSNDGRVELKIGSGQIAQLGDRDDSNNPPSVESVNSEERETLQRGGKGVDFKVRDFPSLEDLEQEINGKDEDNFEPSSKIILRHYDDANVLKEPYSTQKQLTASHRKAKSQITPYKVVAEAIEEQKEKQGFRYSLTPDSENYLVDNVESDVDNQDKQMRELLAEQPCSSENS